MKKVQIELTILSDFTNCLFVLKNSLKKKNNKRVSKCFYVVFMYNI